MTDRFFEIQAKEYLEPGQNLLDQEPFIGAARHVFSQLEALPEDEQYGYRRKKAVPNPPWKSEVGLRRMIRPLVWTYEELYENLEYEYRNFFQVFNGVVNSSVLKSLARERTRNVHQYTRMVDYMLKQSLRDVPYWPDYIHSEGGHYYANGDFDPSQSAYPIAKSYPHWAVAKARRVDRQILLGIDAVFSQDFSGSSGTLPGLPPSSKATTMRYRILRATELNR